MAIQGGRSRRKPNGSGRISKGDQDFFPTGDLVYGFDEGMFDAPTHGLTY